MAWIGNLLLVISLSVGALAAATAYHVPLNLADEQYRYEEDGKTQDLTIKANAGVVVVRDRSLLEQHQIKVLLFGPVSPGPALPGTSGTFLLQGLLHTVSAPQDKLVNKALGRLNAADLLEAQVEPGTGLVLMKSNLPVPLAKKKDRLTPELLQALRQQNESEDKRVRQEYVIVQEFSPSRWPGGGMFLAAVGGLLVGAMLVRTAAKRKRAEEHAAQPAEGPEQALVGLQETLETVRRDVGAGQEPLAPEKIEFRLQLILERLSEAQKTHITAFLEARATLITRYGLAGFATIMDHFAGCERQINRAWSAAADGVFEEAVHCLRVAAELLEETMAQMRQQTSHVR
jgi:hypothetical protein